MPRDAFPFITRTLCFVSWTIGMSHLHRYRPTFIVAGKSPETIPDTRTPMYYVPHIAWRPSTLRIKLAKALGRDRGIGEGERRG